MPRSKMKPWQRPDGWYEVSIYPFGKQHWVLGRTADEAMRNAVRAFQRSFTPEQSDAAKASEPQDAQAGQRVSLAQFVRQWLESISEDVEPKTAQGYRQTIASEPHTAKSVTGETPVPRWLRGMAAPGHVKLDRSVNFVSTKRT